jgi:hypothetical protein
MSGVRSIETSPEGHIIAKKGPGQEERLLMMPALMPRYEAAYCEPPVDDQVYQSAGLRARPDLGINLVETTDGMVEPSRALNYIDWPAEGREVAPGGSANSVKVRLAHCHYRAEIYQNGQRLIKTLGVHRDYMYID